MELQTYTNGEMEKMANDLRKHLDRTDIIGYAAARNVRILENELREYIKVKTDLVTKYGTAEMDEEGNPTGIVEVRFDSDQFPAFLEELGKFATIEHAPALFKIKYSDAIGNLSGTELLEIEWMFED